MSDRGGLRLSNPTREQKRLYYPKGLSVIYEGFNRKIHVSGPNISPRGMFINTNESLPLGAILNVSFQLPSTNFEVNARCEVRYCIPNVGIGVEFINLPTGSVEATQKEIGEYPASPSAVVPT